MSSCVESEGEGKEVEAGDVADDEMESAGVGCEAKGLRHKRKCGKHIVV
jgi:hypothetical protein